MKSAAEVLADERPRMPQRKAYTMDETDAFVARIAELEQALIVLGMRVLQSDLVLDDEQIAARDLGVALNNAAMKGGQQ